jgi:hypothetical protein
MTKSPIAIGLGSEPTLKLGPPIFQASLRAAACGEFAPIAAKRDVGPVTGEKPQRSYRGAKEKFR